MMAVSHHPEWRVFYHQKEAFAALSKHLHSNVGLFAFQRPPLYVVPKKGQKRNGPMLYVLADRDTVGKVCLGLENPPDGSVFRFRQYGFEQFAFHDQPMVAYADCEYTVELNPKLERSVVLGTLLNYVKRVCSELWAANAVDASLSLESLKVNIETSHRAEKVSYHIKLPHVVLEDMKAQHAFWGRVMHHIKEDQRAQLPEALQLDVRAYRKDEVETVPFLDMSVYIKNQGQCFRLLGAAKNDGSVVRSFLVLEGRKLGSITLEQWLEALVLRPFAKEVLKLPMAWYGPRGPSSSSSFTKSIIPLEDRQGSEQVHSAAALLCRLIDPKWLVPAGLIRLQDKGSCLWITFKANYYCPLKGDNHDTTATMIVILPPFLPSLEGWRYKIICQSSNHGSSREFLKEGLIKSPEHAKQFRAFLQPYHDLVIQL